MLPSSGHFSEVPCLFFLSGSCNRPHCHFRHCARDKTNDDGKLPSLPKTAKGTETEWLGPNLRLSQVTLMVEKAVDRALLANPDKKLDRATMISQALETLRRDSIAAKAGGSKTSSPTPSTSTGFPSYKPTPISILNKRHIPVVAMPVKPMVIRKDKRPDEKTLIGASHVTPHDFTSHTSKPDLETLPDAIASSKVPIAENNSSECESTLVRQISDFLGTEMRTNCPITKTANNDNELPSPPFSQDSESSEHSNTDSLDANGSMGKNDSDQGIGSQCSNANVNIINSKSNPSLHVEVENESNVQSSSIEAAKSIDDERPEGITVMMKQKEIVPKDIPLMEKIEEIRNISDPLPTKHKEPERHQEHSYDTKAPDRRHSSDTKKGSDLHKKSEKSVHRSSKHKKDGKSDHRKDSEKEKNGDDSQTMEKPIKDSERESCDKKPSLHHANFPKKFLPTEDQSKSHPKKSDREHHEKKAHPKSLDKDNQNQKEKNHKSLDKDNQNQKEKNHKSQDKDNQNQKEKHHHSHKHTVGENDRKREYGVEKSKPTDRSSKTKCSSSSNSKSKSSEKRSSSHSKDRDKAKKRRTDDEYEKRTKVAKITTEGESVKKKKLKSEAADNSPSDGSNQIEDIVGARSRRNSGSRECDKRKLHADSDNDFDFIDVPSPRHKAIVISSSSSDECQDEWTSSSAIFPHASKSDDEIVDGMQTAVVDFKWSKAKEIIQRSTNSKMPRIAHVPNVMNFLSAKTRLLSQEKKPVTKPVTHIPSPSSNDQKNENGEGPQPKIMRRVAHGSQGTESRPVVKHVDNVKVSPGIRQHYCNVFYDELCKYLDPEKAKKLAVEEELDVAKRCKIHKIYQNNCSLLLLKIRKMKGNIGKGEQAAVKWTGSSTPEFTYGLALYKCFEKYLVSEEELIKNGYPMPLPGQPTCAYIEKNARKYSVQQPDEPFKRRCSNCRKTYEIDQDGMPTTVNDCNYHWGRMRKVGGRALMVEKYTCCDGADDSVPCQSNAYHVWSGKNEDCIPGFVKTREWPTYRDDSEAGVYAFDCEMCYTTRGLELARLTVVDLNEDVIFDEVIALDNPILDYCTRFSGIDEDKMRQATFTFQDVRNWVLNNFFDKTILIGHSLENDLNALKVFHKRIVDTSITFPHKFGPPMKNSLKNLTMSMLALAIQENEAGHDSKEDAVACLKLMMKRIKEDAKVRKPRVIIGYAGKKR